MFVSSINVLSPILLLRKSIRFWKLIRELALTTGNVKVDTALIIILALICVITLNSFRRGSGE